MWQKPACGLLRERAKDIEEHEIICCKKDFYLIKML